MNKLGENIKRLRELKGISQDELAKMVGYSGGSTISCIESGKRGVSQEQLFSFANALEVSLDDLFCIRKFEQAKENRYPTTSSRIKDISMEEVVVVKTIEGEGTEDSPYYCIYSYWTKGGKKIGEIRPREER